jgi:hypothetical protein
LVLIVLAASVPRGAVAATPAALDAHDRWFRDELGYPTDDSYIERMAVSPDSARYGAPLTESEVRDLDRRVAVQEGLDGMISEVNRNPDALSGIWLDQTRLGGNGVSIIVGVPRDRLVRDRLVDERLLARLSALAPSGAPVVAADTDYSLRHLRSAFDQVEARIPDLIDDGYSIRTWRMDVRANRVVVSMSPAKASVFADLGPAVIVVPEAILDPVACNPADRCTYLPYRGGLQIIDRYNSSNWWQCTSGLWAKATSGGTFYMITAAHCQKAGSAGVAYRNTDVNTRLGTWSIDSIPGTNCGTTCPANTETIRVTVDFNRVPATGRNLVYSSSTTKSYAITSFKGYALMTPGATVCGTGVVSSLDCGFIDSLGGGTITVDRYSKPITVSKGIYYQNLNVSAGDSGGPSYVGGVAYGITSSYWQDGSKVGSFASAVGYAALDLNVTICLNSTCSN